MFFEAYARHIHGPSLRVAAVFFQYNVIWKISTTFFSFLFYLYFMTLTFLFFIFFLFIDFY